MKYVLLTALVVGNLLSQPGPAQLRNGWRLQPAGRQIPLDTFPMSTALSKDGKHLLVLNGGAKAPSITVLNAESMEAIGNTPVPDGWLGLTFAPNGQRVYVGGGSRGSVFEFAWADGKLTPAREFLIVPEEKRTPDDFIGDVAVSPDGRMLYAAGLYHNAIHVINLQSGRVIERFPTGRRPYRILFHPDGKSYFVSSWADATVYHHDALKGERLGFVRLGQHTTDMVWRARKSDEKSEEQARWAGRLFVTAANTNTVFVVGVSEGKDMQRIETINVAMTPLQPAGMTPSALALDADQSRLFVACSDANAVAVVDLSEARSMVEAFIPVGWYPTAVRALSNGSLVVLNGRGTPNGSASVIDIKDETALLDSTRSAMRNSPYRDELLDFLTIPEGNPIPARPGDPSPIQHVIYVSVAGAAGGPNHTKLAGEFVRIGNFVPTGDNPAEGIQWSTAAIVPDYVQKLAGRRTIAANDPAALPPAGYLWSNAASAGIAIRDYGLRQPIDGDAVKTFLADLAQQPLARLTLVRLEGDATDTAVGALAEAVSKSRFWAATAIFVVPDHGQGNAPALALSPFTRRGGFADNTPYNTLSVLRTIELILGMRPMTVFDASARPMWNAFSQKPDARP